MKRSKDQKGFAHGLILLVVVVAVVAAVGWKVYDSHKTKPVSSSSAATSQVPAESPTSTAVTNVSPAPAIKSSSDLDNALKVLDANDPSSANSSDSSQLSSQSNF